MDIQLNAGAQKAFDSQLHIIRDVHFDVDKYKVGELYVINNTLEGIRNFSGMFELAVSYD